MRPFVKRRENEKKKKDPRVRGSFVFDEFVLFLRTRERNETLSENNKTMSKKDSFIFIAIAAIILAGAGFYAWKKIKAGQKEEWRDFLVLEIKNSDLPDYALARYKEDFYLAQEDLEKDITDFNAWLELGLTKKVVGDYEGAAEIWVYASNLQPQNTVILGNLGDLYGNFMSKPEEAELMYKKALSINSKDENLIVGLADLYRYRLPGKENLYEPTLLDGLKAAPDNPSLVAALASYYRNSNQTQKAIEYYKKLIKLNPGNETAKEDLAELELPK